MKQKGLVGWNYNAVLSALYFGGSRYTQTTLSVYYMYMVLLSGSLQDYFPKNLFTGIARLGLELLPLINTVCLIHCHRHQILLVDG